MISHSLFPAYFPFAMQIALLTAVTELNLGRNEITGTLPTEIGRLTKVETGGDYGLVWGNELTGTLATQIGLMSQMTFAMCVNENMFTGTVPSQLGTVAKMEAWMVRRGYRLGIGNPRITTPLILFMTT